MLVIGLDLGTQFSGITILDDKQSVIFQDYWDTRTKKCKNPEFVDLFDKITYAKVQLKKIKKDVVKNQKVKIIIEQNLQMFRSGKSSAKTLNIIAKFNGSVSFLCYDIFKVKPEYIAASSARKRAGIKIDRSSAKNAKEQSFDFAVENWGLTYELTNSKKPRPRTFYFDISDSFVLAKSYFGK